VVEEVSMIGGRLADPSSEMSVVASAPRSEPNAKAVATMITRNFIVSPVVGRTVAATVGRRGVVDIGGRCPTWYLPLPMLEWFREWLAAALRVG
jgi:hypothetical protein